jgi:RpiB/LacA/LacB family sugar-phosphate isomerase
MRIAFGCDHRGFPHKSAIVEALEADGHAILDLGTFSEDPVDYPDYARAVANAVRNNFVDVGVLLCGTGVGASIAANKIRGIRAALVHDELTARQSRADDDANVLCLGARVNDIATTIGLARIFLATPFSNAERHVRRVAKVLALENGLPPSPGRLPLRRAPEEPETAEPAKGGVGDVTPVAPPPVERPAPARVEPSPGASPGPAASRARGTPVSPPPSGTPAVAAAPAGSAPAVEAAAPRAATAGPRSEAGSAALPVLDDGAHVDPATFPPVRDALRRLDAMDFGERLWVKDAALWSTAPEVQATIRNRLGWLTVPTLMREYTADLKDFATEVRRLGYSHVLLLGMGGASLAAEVLSRTFGSKMGFPDLTVLDSTDPAAVKETLARIPLSRTLFVVSSKSGTTTEAHALYKFFRAQVEASKPPKPGQHFVAITDPGSPLETLAKEGRFRRTFLNHPSIGGRYSALSFFGLVPAALVGVDIDRLLERADEMVSACGASVPVQENPALVLGAVLAGLALRGRDKITFVVSEPIGALGLWLEQLLAESMGKDGKGLIPVDREPLGRPTAYGNDRLFVSIRLAGETADRALDAIEGAGHPVYRLTLGDPLDLGAEFFRWELATAAAGALLGVNPFDEPNVAQAKEATQAMLAAYRKSKRLPESPADREEDGILLLANQGAKPASVREGLAQFLAQAGPGEYVALLAYLAPDHETAAALQGLRAVIRDRFRLATTAGWGPRYLHSTGQLHKGGPPTVRAIQLTGDDRFDVAVPGESYGFSTLKAAQARGDLETLRKEGRRVIRLHLGGRPAAALEKLARMLDETLR